MTTTRDIELAMTDYRLQLALLHEIAAERDALAREKTRRLDRFAALNAQIAAQRAAVAASREKLRSTLNAPPEVP